ncbi:MAG: hypothetical protein WCR98_09005 [Saccharofermentanales bacterium]
MRAIVLIAIVCFLAGYYSGMVDAKDPVRKAISACEKDLPRSQHCVIEYHAVVAPEKQ